MEEAIVDADEEERISAIRRNEFPNLRDAKTNPNGIVYLDYAGAGLYSKTQLQECMTELNEQIYGNPHSRGPVSFQTRQKIKEVKNLLFNHFQASAETYELIFTAGATASLKLVADTFPWSSSSTFACTSDSHNSVLGIRNVVTKSRGGSFRIINSIDDLPDNDAFNLWAFPAECNFSGARNFDLGSIGKQVREKQGRRWYTLLDASKFVTSTRLDLNTAAPDFAVLSFYKIFGYPTGIGALFVRKSVAQILQKTYYGGGTISEVLSDVLYTVPRSDNVTASFEDGTPSFLSILSLRHGLNTINRFGKSMEDISERTNNLTTYFYQKLRNLKHDNGNPVVIIYGNHHNSSSNQGPVITCNFLRQDGESFVGHSEVERLAGLHNIQIRSGCFCNPGACQSYLGISNENALANFKAGHVCWDDEVTESISELDMKKAAGAVRFSIGYVSTLEDITYVLDFIFKFFVKTEVISNLPLRKTSNGNVVVLEKMVVYPVKSCRGFKITESWPVGPNGLLYDRSWAIVDASTGKALRLRDEPALSQIHPFIDLERNVLTLQCNNKTIDIEILNDTGTSKAASCEISLCGQKCYGVIISEATKWISSCLGYKAYLLKTESKSARAANEGLRRRKKLKDNDDNNATIGFSNEGQFLVLSSSSVKDLNDRLEKTLQVSEDAFRANFIIGGTEPFEDDSWSSVTIGNHEFNVSGPCARCSMVNLDPNTGEFYPGVLRLLSTYRRDKAAIYFGQFLTHKNTGGKNTSEIVVGSSVLIKR